MSRNAWLALPFVLVFGAAVSADSYQEPYKVLKGLIDEVESDYLTASQQNLMMMQDNPAYWTVDDGEALFYEKRGPKNASLEQCDFGKGPGVVEGAYAEMPRYFEDTGRVMDLGNRLMYCMKEYQGFTEDDPALKRHGSSDFMKIQTYIANESSGYEWDPPLEHPMAKAMRDAGEAMFYRRAGKFDFSCNSCHGVTGQRIRASVNPNMNRPDEWTKAISWPTYRVGHQQVRSSLHRLRGCYWQMRQGRVRAGSDASIAMLLFWTDAASGEPAILPDMKR